MTSVLSSSKVQMSIPHPSDLLLVAERCSLSLRTHQLLHPFFSVQMSDIYFIFAPSSKSPLEASLSPDVSGKLNRKGSLLLALENTYNRDQTTHVTVVTNGGLKLFTKTALVSRGT